VRWLLLPLLLLALLAPRTECPVRAIIQGPITPAANTPALLIPPLRVGHPLARLGTDRAGRDAACLLQRGLARSLLVSLSVLALGVLPGLALGLWLAWWPRITLLGEVMVLLALVLLLGRESFRLVLALGVALLTARLVAVRAGAVLREPFVEGALALGAAPHHLLTRHLWPHLRPALPAVLATVLSSVFLWLMELGALGFHDQPVLSVAFTDGNDRTQDVLALPLNADLGQLISFFRWTWLDIPEQLVWPVLLLIGLSQALKDVARRTAPRP
jgi:ABC-type dipeptide/oligopeptide/nickel transport system permease subunit